MNGEIFQWIGSAATLGLVGLCVNLSRQVNGKLNVYAHKDVCEEKHKGIEDKFKTIGNDLTEIKSDVKEILSKH